MRFPTPPLLIIMKTKKVLKIIWVIVISLVGLSMVIFSVGVGFMR